MFRRRKERTTMFERIREDIRCVFDRDPAARTVWRS